MTKNNLGFQLPSLEEFIEVNPLTISPQTLVIDAITWMNQPRTSRVCHEQTENQDAFRSSYLLVLEQSRLAGVLTERDIVKLSATSIDLKTVTVEEVMTKNVITLKKSDFQDIYQIMSVLRQYKIRHLPVVDDDRQLVGMISSEGICRALNPTNLLKLRSIADVMNTEVLQASPNSSILSLSQLMAEQGQSCVVIVANKLSSARAESPNCSCQLSDKYLHLATPIGIVTERDIVQFQILGLDLTTTIAQTVMSSPLVCMKPTDSLLMVQQQMKKLRVRRLVVAGESEKLQGIIGFQDMLGVFNTTELYGVISTLQQELNQQTEHLTKEIEQREKSELMLRENQQLLELFVRHAPAAIAMLDRELRYLVVSDRWIRDYQLENQDIIGLTHYEVFPEVPQRWKQDHQDVLTGKVEVLKSEEDSFVRPDGRTDWLRWELRPWHDLEGQIGGFLMLCEVITERKLLEQKLFAEKELAQVTLKSIGDAVITTDALGQVEYVNPVAERLTGWGTAEAKGKPLADIFQIVNHLTRETVTNPVDVAIQENRIYEPAADTLLIAKDGTEYAIEDSAAPIKDRQGKLIGAVVVFHDVTQARSLAHELSWQATHDPLTGLYNRRKFEKQIDIAIKDAQNNKTHYALCYLDLDRFKIVNDTCGHAAGDELLRQVTTLLQQRIRDSDVFARLGGDEFGLLLPQCPINVAQEIANQLRQLVHDFRFVWSDKVFRIGVSIGLVAVDSTAISLSGLLNTADAACYVAKEKGRNCIHIYHEQDTVIAQQRGERQWVAKINRALESNRFCLYAQKIISIEENVDLDHCEILLRLVDSSGEIILPGTFIPAAERYDLMPAIDRWVVSTFLAGYEAYCQLGQEQELPNPTKIYTINLSGASLNSQDFAVFLQEQFDRYSIPPETICFEITETVAISNLDNAVTLIEQLKHLGCSIALDDFGSGMCSLTYLKNLPVDYLKIDGSFIKNIGDDRIDYATVECFNYISQIMNVKTIAEFVENDSILDSLKQIGINYAQGYGIERPQPLTFD